MLLPYSESSINTSMDAKQCSTIYHHQPKLNKCLLKVTLDSGSNVGGCFICSSEVQKKSSGTSLGCSSPFLQGRLESVYSKLGEKKKVDFWIIYLLAQNIQLFSSLSSCSCFSRIKNILASFLHHAVKKSCLVYPSSYHYFSLIDQFI